MRAAATTKTSLPCFLPRRPCCHPTSQEWLQCCPAGARWRCPPRTGALSALASTQTRGGAHACCSRAMGPAVSRHPEQYHMKPRGDTVKNDVLLFLKVIVGVSDVQQPSSGHPTFHLACPGRLAPWGLQPRAPHSAQSWLSPGLSGKCPATQNESQRPRGLGLSPTALPHWCGLGGSKQSWVCTSFLPLLPVWPRFTPPTVVSSSVRRSHDMRLS